MHLLSLLFYGISLIGYLLPTTIFTTTQQTVWQHVSPEHSIVNNTPSPTVQIAFKPQQAQIYPPTPSVPQAAPRATKKQNTPNTYLLNYLADNQSIDSLRITIGKRIKQVLKQLSNDPQLSEKARKQLYKAKIRPVEHLHMTTLYIGYVPPEKQDCVQQTILQTLNNHTRCANDWFHVTIPPNPRYDVFGNFVVIVLSEQMPYRWQTLPAALDCALYQECSLKTTAFMQHPTWVGHVSLNKISVDNKAILYERTSSGKTIKEEIAQALNTMPAINTNKPWGAVDLKKLYISPQSRNGKSTLFIFDEQEGMWKITTE